jgi:O-antigen/teichoic acid export membrane protein
MDKRVFLKHAAAYGAANLLVQAGGFLLLPLYIRCLTPAEYGVLEVLSRLAETVGTCLMFGGFRQALLTFYQQCGEEVGRRRIVSSTLGLMACACLGGGALVLALAGPLSTWLGGLVQEGTAPLSAGLLRLAVLGILLEPLSLIPLALAQARREAARFVAVTLTQFLVRISLCIVLVRWLHWGIAGALAATAVTGFAYGFGLSAWELARGAAWPDPTQVRALVAFALPLMPGGLCFFFLHHGDRFFLFHYCAAHEVGTYALGYKLAMVASMFSMGPLYAVWSTYMYEVARQPGAPTVFGRVFTRVLAAYLLVSLGVCLFQDEIVGVLGGPAYAASSRVVAPVVLACFCQAAASLMDAGLYVRHRTGLKLAVTLLTAAAMLLLYGLLIPSYGSMGAALATLGGFAFLAGSTWWVTQRVFPVRYEWGRLAALLALTVGLWLGSRALPGAAWAFPARVGLWLLWPLLVWHTGLMSSAERQYAAELLRQGLAWAGRGRFPPLRGPAPPASEARSSLEKRASPAGEAGSTLEKRASPAGEAGSTLEKRASPAARGPTPADSLTAPDTSETVLPRPVRRPAAQPAQGAEVY